VGLTISVAPYNTDKPEPEDPLATYSWSIIKWLVRVTW
jgi:hypothetical protein